MSKSPSRLLKVLGLFFLRRGSSARLSKRGQRGCEFRTGGSESSSSESSQSLRSARVLFLLGLGIVFLVDLFGRSLGALLDLVTGGDFLFLSLDLVVVFVVSSCYPAPFASRTLALHLYCRELYQLAFDSSSLTRQEYSVSFVAFLFQLYTLGRRS